MRAIKDADAVLISDYGSGLVQPRFVAELAAKLRARKTPVPILIDSRYALTRYRGLTACTPNESEVEQVLGVKIDDNKRVLERAGRALLERTRMACVLITRGSRGMALFEPDKPTVHIPIFGSDQIADVTGAGDTVMATMTLALAAGGTFEEAARLANYAGGLVVMKRGTATVSAAELRRANRAWVRSSIARALAARVQQDRARGLTIAFANGAFDLLHVGHIRYLEGAKREADRLVVAINSDASVRGLKGPIAPDPPGSRSRRAGRRAARRRLRRHLR